MFDILDTVNSWLDDEPPIYIATVTNTWGSSPRGTGAKMAFRSDLSLIGSVSGGCIESAVIEEGLALSSSSVGKHLHYGVSDDTALEVGLSCGGQAEVFVEQLDKAWWEVLATRYASRETSYAVSIISGDFAGKKAIFNQHLEPQYVSDGLSTRHINQWAQVVLESNQSRQICYANDDLFIDVLRPPSRLLIVGGNHVSIPLSRIAKMLGYDVSLVDPRRAFASEARFAEVDSIHYNYPSTALPEIGIDEQTYIVVLSHDAKIDDPALITALNSTASYIGVISSRRAHEKRLGRLKEAGITDEQLRRIHAPIGLKIGSKSPEEIAVSIISEIIAVSNGVAFSN